MAKDGVLPLLWTLRLQNPLNTFPFLLFLYGMSLCKSSPSIFFCTLYYTFLFHTHSFYYALKMPFSTYPNPLPISFAASGLLLLSINSYPTGLPEVYLYSTITALHHIFHYYTSTPHLPRKFSKLTLDYLQSSSK